MPQDDAIAALLEHLSELNPACQRDNIEWYYPAVWHADQFTRGAYSALRPGAAADTRKRAGQAVADKIFFAGEAFDIEYATTITAAFLSGRRAAQDILSISSPD